MGNDFVYKILDYISKFLALLVVLPTHEFAHAFVAVKSGDITPKITGRYTLNPFAHFDVMGIVCFVLAGFGWAKPVMVNPNNFRHYKRGCFGVAVAGVTTNYITSFLVYPLFMLAVLFLPNFGYFSSVLVNALGYIYVFGLVFFVFNLIPVFPLDGFRVVDVFNKKHGPVYNFLKYQGRYVLIFLFVLSIIADFTGFWQLDILGMFINFVTDIIGVPIVSFWGLFF